MTVFIKNLYYFLIILASYDIYIQYMAASNKFSWHDEKVWLMNGSTTLKFRNFLTAQKSRGNTKLLSE